MEKRKKLSFNQSIDNRLAFAIIIITAIVSFSLVNLSFRSLRAEIDRLVSITEEVSGNP